MSNNVTNSEPVHGYKVFNPDWTCRDFQYEVGKTFEENVKPSCCGRGFHFCKEAVDCFNYYPFNPKNKVAEVIAYGEVKTDGDKSCTNKLEIVREIPWDEVLRIVNIGKNCTGINNTGDWNTGNWNTGDYNTGDWNVGNCNTKHGNSGNKNTGNYNTGNCNAGNRNTGDRNTGNDNTGDWNTGHNNTGDWNASSYNTGCFNTEEQTIMLFNKPSDMTYVDWMTSEAKALLNRIPKSFVEWVITEDMTDEEKAAHPTYKTTGGYLKELGATECCQLWWNNLSLKEKDTIRAIPNFDPDIFYKCTGIRVD